MPFADCRKIVKQGDTLKIRWLDATGLTITCDVYTPAMNKTTLTMIEKPSGSGIYEISYTFNSGDGDYLFVVNGEAIQVSCIPELSNLDAKVSDVKTTVDAIKQNTDKIPEIKSQTDELNFVDGKVVATIDDSALAKEKTLRNQLVEIERLRSRIRVRR